MKLKRSAMVAAAACTGFVLGCRTVGPDYVEPTLAAPDGWASTLPAGMSAEPESLAGWWRGFNDASLTSLIERAVADNLDLKLAAQRIEEARAARGIVAAGNQPTVDAEGSYTRSANSENVFPSFGGKHEGLGHDRWSAGLGANWELDVFGAVRRGVEAADADIQSAEWTRRDLVVMLVSDVASNYVQLRTAQQRAAVVRVNVQTQQQTLDLTVNRKTAGLGSELDVTRARSQLEASKALAPLFDAEARQAIYRLSVLLGKDPGALVSELDKAGGWAIPAVPGEMPVGVPEDLIRRRPDLRAAERNLAAATARVGVATADLYPHFTLGGSVGLAASEPRNLIEGDARFWSLGPGVRWNVFDAGRIRANIAVQESRVDQALTRYESALLGALRDVDSSIVGFAKQREHAAALESAEAAQAKAVELATQLYSKGLTDFLTVLDTQRRLLEIQEQVTASRGAAAQRLIGVYRELGGGWETP